MSFSGIGSVRKVKNCDLGPENAALGRTVFHFTDSDLPAGKLNSPVKFCKIVFLGEKFHAKCELFVQKQFLSVVAIRLDSPAFEVVLRIIL